MFCRQLFETLPTEEKINDRASHISNSKGEGCCEIVSISSYSKGPVLNVEYLFRGVYSPLHINTDTGEIVATLFSDADDKGLSCDRSQVPSASAESRRMGILRAKELKDKNPNSKSGEFVGLVFARALDIRQIQTTSGPHNESHQAMFIYDTGKIDNHEHADVFLDQRPRDSDRKRSRKKLRDLFIKYPVQR